MRCTLQIRQKVTLAPKWAKKGFCKNVKHFVEGVRFQKVHFVGPKGPHFWVLHPQNRSWLWACQVRSHGGVGDEMDPKSVKRSTFSHKMGQK